MPGFNDEQLLEILQLSEDATAIYGSENLRIDFANDKMLEFWGKKKDVVGKYLDQVISEPAGTGFIKLLKEVWHSGKIYVAKDRLSVLFTDSDRYFDLTYRPIADESGNTFCILHTAKEVSDRRFAWEEVKKRTQNEQQLNEELAATNEELNAINEELSSINEEYISTNEELQAVNEEYQATNEELVGRNKELKKAYDELNRVYDELIITEQKARLLLKDAPVAIGIVNCGELILEAANTDMLTFWKVGQSALGKTITSAFSEDDARILSDIIARVCKARKAIYGHDVLKRTGNLSTADTYFNFVYQPIKNSVGDVVSVMVVANEVTEQVESRKIVEHSQKRLREMVMTTPVAMAILQGKELVIEIANKTMFQIWHRNRDETIGKKLLEVFPELNDQSLPGMFDKVFSTGERIELPETSVTIELANGNTAQRYVSFAYDPLFDHNGNVDSILLTSVDITANVLNRKQLEEKEQQLLENNEELKALNEEQVASNEELQRTLQMLLSSESKFRAVIEQAPVAIILFRGSELIIEAVNSKMLELLDKPSDIIGKPLLTAIPELRGQQAYKMLENIYQTGEHVIGNDTPVLLKRNGKVETGYYNFSYTPLIEDNRITGVIDIAVEVTEQVTSRKKLEEAEENLKLAIASADIGTWVVNLKTDTMEVSERTKAIHRVSPGETFTLTDSLKMIVPEHRDEVNRTIQNAIANKESFIREYMIRPRNSNEAKWLRSSGKISTDDDGNATTLVGVFMDVSDQKQLAQRKDDFISVASHELKTPLTSLKASLQLLDRVKEKVDDKGVSKLISQAVKSMDKMSALVDGLLDASRINADQMHLQMEKFNVAKMINECCEQIRSAGNADPLASVDNDLEVFGDENRLSQVLINFLNNAVKYAPNSLRIEVKAQKIKNKIRITVKDFGQGIPADKLPHLFDRFYRTDHAGRQYSGLGLGLYISAEIVKRHDGEIGVESAIGKGSTFWFTLPA